MKQPVTFLVWTDNSPGVLLRLTSLFTRRKINVESLTVSATEQEGISRFTVTISTDPIIAATVGRQIERMIEVRRVFVFAEPSGGTSCCHMRLPAISASESLSDPTERISLEERSAP